MSIFFILVSILGFFDPDLHGINILNVLVLGQALAVAGGFLLNIYFSRSFLQFSRKLKIYWIRTLFQFGRHTLITNISMVLYSNTDQLMLGALINPGAVAVYNIAIRVNNLVQVPTMSMSEILFPKTIERIKESGVQVLGHLYNRSVGAILGLLLPAIIIILLIPGLIIKFLSGANFSEYSEAVPILQLTVLYMIFIPFSRQFGVILEAYGRPQINSRLEILSTVINVISNYYCIIQFGIIGAVYGSLVAIIIKFIINFIYLKNILGINPLRSFNFIFPFYMELYSFIIKKIRSVSKRSHED
jgi:O-antigen/teichoic acid export membrane protein